MHDRPCKRCLLAEAGENKLLESLEELKTALPEEDKTDTDEYERRLSFCRECDELINGTCMQCGCYAEFRALKTRMHCPKNKW